jgi:hypothetical protein
MSRRRQQTQILAKWPTTASSMPILGELKQRMFGAGIPAAPADAAGRGAKAQQVPSGEVVLGR